MADYREEGSEVISKLMELGVNVELRKLEVGDYVVSDRIGIERKSSIDLASSIADGRLFKQAESMVKVFSKPIFIIEGSLDEVYLKRMFKPSQVQGAFAYLIDLGLYIAPSIGPLDTARLIYSLAKREQLQYGGKVKSSLSRMRKAAGCRSLREVQINLIASIPSIGYKTAERILNVFKSPRNFFKATPSELRKVPSLGELRIAKIVETLDTKFEGLSFENY